MGSHHKRSAAHDRPAGPGETPGETLTICGAGMAEGRTSRKAHRWGEYTTARQESRATEPSRPSGTELLDGESSRRQGGNALDEG